MYGYAKNKRLNVCLINGCINPVDAAVPSSATVRVSGWYCSYHEKICNKSK